MSLCRFTCYGDLDDRPIGDCFINTAAITAIGPPVGTVGMSRLRAVTVHGGAAYVVSEDELRSSVPEVYEAPQV